MIYIYAEWGTTSQKIDIPIPLFSEKRILTMNTISFDFNYLSPTGSIGLILLITGIIFTGLMGMVFYKVNNNLDSLEDRARKNAAKAKQKKMIERLYPSQKE